MNILFYYTYEYTQRSGCRPLLERAAAQRGDQAFIYYRELDGLDVIPFKPDVVITRTSVSGTAQDYANIAYFKNVPIINAVQACQMACDKSIYYPLLAASGVHVPAFTVLEAGADKVEEVVFPLVGKLPASSQGRGVCLLSNENELRDFLTLYHGQKIMLQKFERLSHGRDIRVFVIGGEVLVAYERIAREGEFRANIALGGRAQMITCPPELREIALRSARALGLDIAGIDVLYSENGYSVCDVNAAPALEITGFSGLDAARAILDYAAMRVNCGY